MSGSSLQIPDIVAEHKEQGRTVFSTGEHPCKLLTAKESEAATKGTWGANKAKDDPYAIPVGNSLATEKDMRRNAFNQLETIYFFNGPSFEEQLQAFYGLEDTKKKLECGQIPFADFVQTTSDDETWGVIDLVKLFFEDKKLPPQFVVFLINGLSQNGFWDSLLVAIYGAFPPHLAPHEGNIVSKARKYQLFYDESNQEMELFQDYNINQVIDNKDPNNPEKKAQDVKTVAHIKAKLNPQGALRVWVQFHASAFADGQQYAAKIIQNAKPPLFKIMLDEIDSIMDFCSNTLAEEPKKKQVAVLPSRNIHAHFKYLAEGNASPLGQSEADAYVLYGARVN